MDAWSFPAMSCNFAASASSRADGFARASSRRAVSGAPAVMSGSALRCRAPRSAAFSSVAFGFASLRALMWIAVIAARTTAHPSCSSIAAACVSARNARHSACAASIASIGRPEERPCGKVGRVRVSANLFGIGGRLAVHAFAYVVSH